MELNLTKSTILPISISSGSTTTLQTNISPEIFSVSFSFTQILNSSDGHFSTTFNKKSGMVHHNFPPQLCFPWRNGYWTEISWHMIPIFYCNVLSNYIDPLLSKLTNPPNRCLWIRPTKHFLDLQFDFNCLNNHCNKLC